MFTVHVTILTKGLTDAGSMRGLRLKKCVHVVCFLDEPDGNRQSDLGTPEKLIGYDWS